MTGSPDLSWRALRYGLKLVYKKEEEESYGSPWLSSMREVIFVTMPVYSPSRMHCFVKLEHAFEKLKEYKY